MMIMNSKNNFKNTVILWLPFAAMIVIFSGLVYGAAQQNYRQSANDPQIQIAEDVASAISAGTTAPDAIVPPNPTTDMSPSLATFLIVYSATGTPIGSSVELDGKIPSLPAGVTDSTLLHGEDRFTWQPQPGVRIAAVVTHYTGQVSGFVLAGRSIREVELREKQLEIMTGIAALAALIVTFLLLLWVVWMGRSASEHEGHSHMDGHDDERHHQHHEHKEDKE